MKTKIEIQNKKLLLTIALSILVLNVFFYTYTGKAQVVSYKPNPACCCDDSKCETGCYIEDNGARICRNTGGAICTSQNPTCKNAGAKDECCNCPVSGGGTICTNKNACQSPQGCGNVCDCSSAGKECTPKEVKKDCDGKGKGSEQVCGDDGKWGSCKCKAGAVIENCDGKGGKQTCKDDGTWGECVSVNARCSEECKKKTLNGACIIVSTLADCKDGTKLQNLCDSPYTCCCSGSQAGQCGNGECETGEMDKCSQGDDKCCQDCLYKCVDSDNGDSPIIAGTCTYVGKDSSGKAFSKSESDTCLSKSILQEFACEGVKCISIQNYCNSDCVMLGYESGECSGVACQCKTGGGGTGKPDCGLFCTANTETCTGANGVECSASNFYCNKNNKCYSNQDTCKKDCGFGDCGIEGQECNDNDKKCCTGYQCISDQADPTKKKCVADKPSCGADGGKCEPSQSTCDIYCGNKKGTLTPGYDCEVGIPGWKCCLCESNVQCTPENQEANCAGFNSAGGCIVGVCDKDKKYCRGENQPKDTECDLSDGTKGICDGNGKCDEKSLVLTVSISPTTVEQCKSVTFSGSGFTPNGDTDTCIKNLCIYSGKTDESGKFQYSMMVGRIGDVNIPVGTHDAWAFDRSSGKDSNKVQVTVTSGCGGEEKCEGGTPIGQCSSKDIGKYCNENKELITCPKETPVCKDGKCVVGETCESNAGKCKKDCTSYGNEYEYGKLDCGSQICCSDCIIEGKYCGWGTIGKCCGEDFNCEGILLGTICKKKCGSENQKCCTTDPKCQKELTCQSDGICKKSNEPTTDCTNRPAGYECKSSDGSIGQCDGQGNCVTPSPPTSDCTNQPDGTSCTSNGQPGTCKSGACDTSSSKLDLSCAKVTQNSWRCSSSNTNVNCYQDSSSPSIWRCGV
jgi:hypothetical protein